MISGLIEGQEKMSKSNVDSAIFMEDSPEEVKKKIKKAFCKERVVEGNPILDYCKNIIFGARDALPVIRTEENGGNKYSSTYSGPTTPTQNWRRTSSRAICTPTISSLQSPRSSTSSSSQ